jgi:CCR4-NOT transcription complex subunit 3
MPISKPSSTASPIVAPAQPVAKSIMTPSTAPEEFSAVRSKTPAAAVASSASSPTPADKTATTNGNAESEPTETEESVYHLPPGLQDLVQSFDVTKARATANPSPSVQRLLAASLTTCPEAGDAEKPRHYKPQNPYSTPLYYPQEPLSIFDDPRLYDTGRIDTDTLFYLFYYRQGTYQQYLAAKALRNQSWRFHKQYQTWFQRHEEPKNITEEFEQGTYRFFDYESTWLVTTLRPSQRQMQELTTYEN